MAQVEQPASPSTPPDYAPPLDQLLRLGAVPDHEFKRDYTALGVRAEHISELVRMATDDALHHGPEDSPLVWAPLHAWRALAELPAAAAIVPLLELLGRAADWDDEWVLAEVPLVLARLGLPALEPVTTALANLEMPEQARVGATEALANLGNEHPGLRSECIIRLARQLEQFAEQSEILNAFLVRGLLDLQAVAALPVLARAFAAGRVDESVNGDFEDSEIELGVRTTRTHPPKPNRFMESGRNLREALSAPAETGDQRWDGESSVPPVSAPKMGRNDPCRCGSGQKFKKCCGK